MGHEACFDSTTVLDRSGRFLNQKIIASIEIILGDHALNRDTGLQTNACLLCDLDAVSVALGNPDEDGEYTHQKLGL